MGLFKGRDPGAAVTYTGSSPGLPGVAGRPHGLAVAQGEHGIVAARHDRWLSPTRYDVKFGPAMVKDIPAGELMTDRLGQVIPALADRPGSFGGAFDRLLLEDPLAGLPGELDSRHRRRRHDPDLRPGRDGVARRPGLVLAVRLGARRDCVTFLGRGGGTGRANRRVVHGEELPLPPPWHGSTGLAPGGRRLDVLVSSVPLPTARRRGQGKSFSEASTVIMNKYAEWGDFIGREQSDEILRALIEAQRSNVGFRPGARSC